MKALLSTARRRTRDARARRSAGSRQPGPGQLLVRVRACAINYPDVLIIEDKYQFKPPRPFAPGGEIAGTVEAVGEGVSGWAEGDRLIAMIGHGGLPEKVVIAAAQAVPLPPERSFEDGSALILTYATSIHALLDRGRLKAGETLLVLGAAGGVGLAAVELGKAYGARVVAAVSSEEKAEVARAGGGGRRHRLSRRAVRQGRARRRSPSCSRRRSEPAARTSSTIRSAAIMPSRRCARSPGRGAISSSASRPESRSSRSTSPCSRAATSAGSSGAPSRRATRRPMPPMSRPCSGSGAKGRSRRGSAAPGRSSGAARRSPTWRRGRRSASWS